MIKIYSRALEFATWNTVRQNPRSVLKKKEKLKVITVKSVSLRVISPACLALGLLQDCSESDVRQTW